MKNFINVICFLVSLGLFFIGLTDIFSFTSDIKEMNELIENIVIAIRGCVLVTLGMAGLLVLIYIINMKKRY